MIDLWLIILGFTWIVRILACLDAHWICCFKFNLSESERGLETLSLSLFKLQ